jgi:hypothetical protein
MGKTKKAKKQENEGVLNIDAAEVKNLFVELATPEGVILTSTTPQMKDLGPDGYRYTMWGINKKGNRCLIVMTADRDGISPKENWEDKYPAMKTVTGAIVATENQKFATKKIQSLCTKEEVFVTDRTARPVEIQGHYGYAMCGRQGKESGFIVMENGANTVQFSEVTPKFL